MVLQEGALQLSAFFSSVPPSQKQAQKLRGRLRFAAAAAAAA